MQDNDSNQTRRRRLTWITVAIAALASIPAAALLLAFFAKSPKKVRTSGRAPSRQLVANFRKDRAVVIVPWQGHAAIVYKAPSLPLSKMVSDHDDFRPSALIINAEVVDGRDKYTILTDFDPPIEIQVKFPDKVVENARKRASKTKRAPTDDDVLAALQLGFWDGTRWVLFTKEKHNYHLLATGGAVGVVTLRKWGDPPIGAGP